MNGSFTESDVQSPFSLIMPTASVSEPVIAPWNPVSQSAIPLFSTGSAVSDDQPTWRLAVPSLAGAREILTEGARALSHEQDVLLQADRRFAGLVNDLGISGSSSLQGVDAELVATLASSGALPGARIEVEAGSVDGLADLAGDRLRAPWQQVRLLVARTTWTETVVEGRMIARSALDRSGNTLAAWMPNVTLAEAALHNRAVGLALASKQALLRKIMLVIRGALMVTGLVVAPGSALLAIPAIWRYLDQLRVEMFGT